MSSKSKRSIMDIINNVTTRRWKRKIIKFARREWKWIVSIIVAVIAIIIGLRRW